MTKKLRDLEAALRAFSDINFLFYNDR